MTSPIILRRDLTRPTSPPVTARPHAVPLAAAALVVSTALTAVLGVQAAHQARTALDSLRPDSVVATVILGAGTLAALWYAATGLGLLVATVGRRDLGVARWGAPVLRRVAIGTALTIMCVGPAQAAPPDDVAWGSSHAAPVAEVSAPAPAGRVTTPDATPTAGVSATAAAAPVTTPHVPAPASEPATHTVRAGECLWRIAAAERQGASDAAVAARVRAWVAANPRLAANPDLIHPGDVLVVPDVAR